MIKTNNPGNIDYVRGVTSKYAGCTGSDGRRCIFDTPEHGIEAIGTLLLAYQHYHKIESIREAISRWAPPKGQDNNNTDAYIAAVCKSTGFMADQVLNFGDLYTLTALAVAIIKQENGSQPYSQNQIQSGIHEALKG